MRKVFPKASVRTQQLRTYPIEVTVSAVGGGASTVLWSGSQRKLFRKYASDRVKSMKQISVRRARARKRAAPAAPR